VPTEGKGGKAVGEVPPATVVATVTLRLQRSVRNGMDVARRETGREGALFLGGGEAPERGSQPPPAGAGPD
jgi:hypothetical protein